MSIPLSLTGDELLVGTPRPVCALPADCVDIDMTHDGQRFLVTLVREAANNRRIRVVLNWQSLLKR